MLANAFYDLANKDTYTIDLVTLCRTLGINDYSELREAIKNLVSTTLEFNILKNRDNTQWVVTSLLADAHIDLTKGTVTYSYGPFLRSKLNNPQVYARINLAVQRQFKTKYSLALYELMCDHYIKEKGEGHTPWIELEDLKKLLGCAEDPSYKEFKVFNYRVLKPSIKEVNEKSYLKIRVNYNRVGRTIKYIRFTIKGKESADDTVPNLPTIVWPNLPIEDEQSKELFDKLVGEYSLTPKQADFILSNFNSHYINEKLRYVKQKIGSGKVANIGAFTYDAIITDYNEPRRSESSSDVEMDGIDDERDERPPLIPDGTTFLFRDKEYTVNNGVITLKDGTILPMRRMVEMMKSGELRVKL